MHKYILGNLHFETWTEVISHLKSIESKKDKDRTAKDIQFVKDIYNEYRYPTAPIPPHASSQVWGGGILNNSEEE